MRKMLSILIGCIAILISLSAISASGAGDKQTVKFCKPDSGYCVPSKFDVKISKALSKVGYDSHSKTVKLKNNKGTLKAFNKNHKVSRVYNKLCKGIKHCKVYYP